MHIYIDIFILSFISLFISTSYDFFVLIIIITNTGTVNATFTLDLPPPSSSDTTQTAQRNTNFLTVENRSSPRNPVDEGNHQ
jgi:hypothetical protein